MIRNILLPTDGSASALIAAETLADLAAIQPESRVTAVIAIAPLDAATTDFDEELVVRHNRKMREHAQAALDATCKILSQAGVTHTSKIVEGDPVSAALTIEVENGNYDAIVMGSRGLGMDRNDLHYLGSVTEHVIRRVNIPVLVIPIHKVK